jgi:hypothetical protein
MTFASLPFCYPLCKRLRYACALVAALPDPLSFNTAYTGAQAPQLPFWLLLVIVSSGWYIFNEGIPFLRQ